VTPQKRVNFVHPDDRGRNSSELLGHKYKGTLCYNLLFLSPTTAQYCAVVGNNENLYV
jgi:hypothetical protein